MSHTVIQGYRFLPEVFLRTPWYSFSAYAPERLPAVLSQPLFRNALWLASPALYQELAAKDFDPDVITDKQRFTLLKYYNRMSFRPVPFGLFAGFTLLCWAQGQKIEVAEDQDSLLHLLPDQSEFSQLPGNGLFICNPTLYRLGREYRYLRSSPDEKGSYRFQIHALTGIGFYRSLFLVFRGGPLAEEPLLAAICRIGACDAAAGAAYLQFLIAEQIIYRSSRGTLLSPRNKIIRCPEFNPPLPGNFIADQEDLQAAARRANKQVFYAAAERPLVAGNLSNDHHAELLTAIDALARLSQPSALTTLENFKAAFRARFDQQQVPLMEALDPDTGIAFGSTSAYTPQKEWLEDVRFPEAASPDPPVNWTPVHRLIFKKLSFGDRSAADPLVITSADIAGLAVPDLSGLPNTLPVIFRQTTSGLQIEQAGGVTGNGLLGRFTAFSDEVTQLCRRLAEMEAAANPGVLLADISQLSDLHVDNINRRRRIYPYEIPLNVFSALPAEAQLLPADLLLSVRGEEILLMSGKHGRRVIPRLATAYNHTNNELGLFRLLCELPYQGLRTSLTFEPERLFPGLGFYPRVLFEKTVISPAKWLISPAETGKFRGPAGEFNLAAFRKQYQLPPRLTMGIADQQLVFDLDDDSGAAFFVRQLGSSNAIRIQEYLMPAGEIVAGGSALAGQYLAILAHDQQVYRPLSNRSLTQKAPQRHYLLGSTWIYLKLYATQATADRILARVVRPLVQRHSHRIENWFFIRYHDPAYHLRLRLRTSELYMGELLADLRERLAAGGFDRLLHDYQGSIYQRELERYGADQIVLVEDLFCSGSDLAIWLLSAREKGVELPAQFFLGLLIAAKMIAIFLPDASRQRALAAHVSGKFLQEFKADKKTRADLDSKYRLMRPEVNRLLEEDGQNSFPRPLKKYLQRMLKQTRVIAKSAENSEKEIIEGLSADLVHMQLNRIFSSGQRKQELIVWYVLDKHLRSRGARVAENQAPGSLLLRKR